MSCAGFYRLQLAHMSKTPQVVSDGLAPREATIQFWEAAEPIYGSRTHTTVQPSVTEALCPVNSGLGI
jgi:hypothetical protein